MLRIAVDEDVYCIQITGTVTNDILFKVKINNVTF